MKRMWSKNELKSIANTQAKNVEKDITTLVDGVGHPRFIEGDGVPLEQEGYTDVYCKWSLSGTHIMFVVAGNIADTTTITNGASFGVFELPEWIMDKIYPVFANELEIKVVTTYASDWSSQDMACDLAKVDGKMKIRLVGGNFTASADRNFRAQFDLLIDNE